MEPIRALTADDADWVLALNAANEVETSPLDRAKFEAMRADAFQAVGVGQDAFMLVFDQHARIYDSVNYLWFRDRFESFAYVDRIVVSEAARGRGLARRLYEALFLASTAKAHPFVGCEVNLDPPNPVSDAFHARLGFDEIGRAALSNGKTVRYLARSLS